MPAPNDLGLAIWQNPLTKTVLIDITSPVVNQTIHTPDADKRFTLHYLVVQATGADATLVLESNAVAISGNFLVSIAGNTRERTAFLSNAGFPILIGEAPGESFDISVSGVGAFLDGYCVVSEI